MIPFKKASPPLSTDVDLLSSNAVKLWNHLEPRQKWNNRWGCRQFDLPRGCESECPPSAIVIVMKHLATLYILLGRLSAIPQVAVVCCHDDTPKSLFLSLPPPHSTHPLRLSSCQVTPSTWEVGEGHVNHSYSLFFSSLTERQFLSSTPVRWTTSNKIFFCMDCFL